MPVMRLSFIRALKSGAKVPAATASKPPKWHGSVGYNLAAYCALMENRQVRPVESAKKLAA